MFCEGWPDWGPQWRAEEFEHHWGEEGQAPELIRTANLFL